MTDNNVKKIAGIVKQEIVEALEPVHKKLDEHSAKLDIHTLSLVTIEDTLKGYGDMYEVNKDKIEELNERVGVVENQIGITPQK